MDALTRTRLLTPLAKDASLAQYLIDAVWLTEWKSSSPDWSGLHESLGTCWRLATNWGANGLASAIATALVRVTNENLNRPLEARSLGEGFIRDLGSDPRLVDVIAGTYDWTQQSAEALRLRKRILPNWKPTFFDSLGPVIGRRKAAISAIKSGEWASAHEILLDAAAMPLGDSKPLHIGPLADAGYAAIRARKQHDGVGLILSAIELLRGVPNSPDVPEAFRIHKMVGHLSTVLVKEADGSELQEMPPAGCSHFDIPDALLKLPRAPSDYSILNICRYAVLFAPGLPEVTKHLQQLRACPFTCVRFLAAGAEAEVAVLRRALDEVPATALAFAKSYAYGRANMPEGEGGVWHQSTPPDCSTPAGQPSILQMVCAGC